MVFMGPYPDGLDVNELADSKLREFATVSGMLHAANRQTRIGGNHAVYEHGSSFELFNELRLFRGVVGPGCGAESKRRCVRNLNRFVDIGHAKEHCHWSEDLFA